MNFDQVMQSYLKGECTADEQVWLLDMALKAINSIGSVSTSFNKTYTLPKFPEPLESSIDAALISIVDDEYGAIVSFRIGNNDVKKMTLGYKQLVIRDRRRE